MRFSKRTEGVVFRAALGGPTECNMPNGLSNLLKSTYRMLSRYPAVVRWREAFRKNVQMHYWPWYRLPPRRPGTDPNARYEHELIVSLTSFPARIHLVRYAIHSLLKQSLKPNRLVLWLGEDKFPGKEADLPAELLALKALGLEIRWCEDVKSATKLIPSLREWPDAIIVTADDDLHYPRPWLESLYQSYLEHNTDINSGAIEAIVWDEKGMPRPFGEWEWNPADSHSAFGNTQVAGFGALYPPHCLHPDVLDAAAFLRLSPSADDLWFWTMAVRHGTKIHLVQKNRQQPFVDPRAHQTPSLWSQNSAGGGNDRCFGNLIRTYPELLQILRAEYLAGGQSHEHLSRN